jgi:hypothetical protein
MVTEWPMAHTIPDCWSLIYDHDCNSVVVLANPDDHNVSSVRRIAFKSLNDL